MKVLAINGSPKNNGNTATALMVMEEVFKSKGIEFEMITIGNQAIRGCIACGLCAKAKSGRCEAFKDDAVNIVLEKVEEADALIIGSPVYYSGMNGTLKSLLDRVFYAGGTKNLFRGKVGAVLAAVRRTGGSETFFDLMKYLTYSQMVIATSTYWNVIHGRMPGEASQDLEGVVTLQTLADNMAYLLEVLDKTEVALPERRERAWTHFIR
ncbi:MAG: flavodoxin family protein [Lachnospirales bacterium]